MPKLSAAIAALERDCGFLSSRTRGIARQLQEHGLVPLGGPGAAPRVTLSDFITLLIAVATDDDAKHLAPKTVATYRAMSLAGLPLNESAPAGFVSAATALDALAEMALASRADVQPVDIEFVATWPEIAFLWRDGAIDRYQPTGTAPGFWQGSKHRKSTIIPGAAFADVVRSLFL